MPVVMISTVHHVPWYRQFPHGEPVWGNWRFTFNDTAGGYDFLVVFDDLHAEIVPACPRAHTVHIATEPVSVRRYHKLFTDQFGLCITHDLEIVHPHAVHGQPGLNWFIGWKPAGGAGPGAMSFADIEALFDGPRSRLVSVIASNLAFTEGHRKRLALVEALREHFGERMDFFGRGFRSVDDKSEALLPYRFHVVLENAQLDHYFSEKLSDCFLAGCFPIYAGCPHLEEYFPPDAYVAIDMAEPKAAIAAIEAAIAGDYDRTRRDALREARQRVLYEHNLFPMLVRVLSDMAAGRYGRTEPVAAYGPALWPRRSVRDKLEPMSLRQRLGRWADRVPPLNGVRRLARQLRSR